MNNVKNSNNEPKKGWEVKQNQGTARLSYHTRVHEAAILLVCMTRALRCLKGQAESKQANSVFTDLIVRRRKRKHPNLNDCTMQKSSIRLTVLLAMALALVAVLPDAVHGAPNKAKSSHGAARASHGAPRASHGAPRASHGAAAHHGKQRTSDEQTAQKTIEDNDAVDMLHSIGYSDAILAEIQALDTNGDGNLSFEELDAIPQEWTP